MQRLIVFEHHKVGDVHHVADGAQPGTGEAVLQPLGRRPDAHPVDDRGRVAVAKVRVCYGDADPFAHGRAGLLVARLRLGDRAARQSRHLVGHSQHGKAVQAVRRQFQVQHGIAQVVRQRLPQRSVLGQDDDACVVVSQAQLQLGADHALRLHAPNACCRQRLVPAAVGVVQEGANPGEAYLLALSHVGGAADHLHLLRVSFGTGASGDGAEPQPVGVGMLPDAGDAANVHFAPSACLNDLTHLHAGHGKPVGQL